MMGFGMGLGLLLLLLFWGALIAGGVWLVGAFFKRGTKSLDSGPEGGPGSREILDQRYSRGEITREEYQRIRADLNL